MKLTKEHLKPVSNQVMHQVDDQVYWRVRKQVRVQAWYQVRDQVYWQVRSQLIGMNEL